MHDFELLTLMLSLVVLGMAQQQQQAPSFLDSYRQTYNLATWVFAIQAALCEPYLRKWGSWGRNYMRLNGLLACVWLPFFGGLFGPHADAMPLFLFGVLSLFLLLIHGIRRKEVEGKPGYVVHSKYKGDSIFWPGKKGYQIEAVVVIAVGFLVLQLSAPLGLYLMGGGIALAFNQSVIDRRDDAVATALSDAALENVYLAARIRRRFDDFN